ncbi:MAG: restriction endonuclease subunit S [Synechococcus sp. SB0666_bin_14]|nr:restriction endonuclease subunit S [Synechococcus sp. SB0666_bin_14]MYG46655.1 restriction endonuclease subunit S [Synechococcus sp. SB0675_bin_6]MYK90743.1 restriction endonuclease subunit S [Synechococcus sp. SB0669_bin_8]
MTNHYARPSIGDLCNFVSGNGFRPSDWRSSGLPIIRIQNLNGSRSFNYFAGQPKEKWIVNPGDLLFAWAGVKGVSFGPTIWSGPRGVLNQHIFRVVPKKDVEKYWLYLILQVITRKIEANAHGFKSSLVHVHKEDIANQVVNLPPLPEQRKIAEILGAWDRAIELTSALLAAARTRKRGLMQILLTGRCRFSEFEGQPWREVRLGEVISGKKNKGKIVPTNDNGVGIPYIGATAFEGKFLNFTEADNAVLCKPEDLLVLWDGENAGAAAFGLRGAVSSTVVRFQLDEKRVVAPFISELIWLYNSEVRAIREGSGIPHMPKHFETWFKFLLPSVNEQRRISDVLTSQQDEIYALQKQIENLHLQKKSLMQKLLTGEWRVSQNNKGAGT